MTTIKDLLPGPIEHFVPQVQRAFETLVSGNVILASSYTSLATMISAIGSTPSFVLIDSTISVPANATIPATISLWFIEPGNFSVASTKVLTIKGAVVSTPRQIFTGAGTVSFTGNQTGIKLNVKWWGAVGDDSTDNTAIFRLAMDAAHTLKIATILVPSGVYRIDSAAIGSAGHKSRIPFPTVAPGVGEWDEITLEGTSAPVVVAGTVVNTNPSTTLASIIKTTQTGDALIGGDNSGPFTAVKAILRNLVLRCPDNPQVIAFDANFLVGYELDHVIIDTGQYTTAVVQPTHATGIGIRGPINSAGGDQTIRHVAIQGYYTGMTNTEQLDADYLIISGNVVGIEVPTATHPSHFGYLQMYNNTTNILVSAGGCIFNMDLLDIEHASVAVQPTLPAWQVTTYDIDDASSLGRGRINFQAGSAGGGMDDIFLRNGAKYFNLHQVRKAVPLEMEVYRSTNLAIPDSPTFGVTTVTWTVIRETPETGISVPFTTYSIPQSGKYLMEVMCEMEATNTGAATFQLNLLQSGTKIDNDVRTAITGWQVTLRIVRELFLEEGDTMSVTIYQDFGANRNLVANGSASPRFSVMKIQN